MVAEAIRTRSLTWEGVSGAPAPSMTASAVATGWDMPKVAAMRRSSSPSKASPVRYKDAYASVQTSVKISIRGAPWTPAGCMPSRSVGSCAKLPACSAVGNSCVMNRWLPSLLLVTIPER